MPCRRGQLELGRSRHAMAQAVPAARCLIARATAEASRRSAPVSPAPTACSAKAPCHQALAVTIVQR